MSLAEIPPTVGLGIPFMLLWWMKAPEFFRRKRKAALRLAEGESGGVGDPEG